MFHVILGGTSDSMYARGMRWSRAAIRPPNRQKKTPHDPPCTRAGRLSHNQTTSSKDQATVKLMMNVEPTSVKGVVHKPESERDTERREGAAERASDERGGENDEGSAPTTKRGDVPSREEGITRRKS